MMGENEAEIFIIAILGGKKAILGGKQNLLEQDISIQFVILPKWRQPR